MVYPGWSDIFHGAAYIGYIFPKRLIRQLEYDLCYITAVLEFSAVLLIRGVQPLSNSASTRVEVLSVSPLSPSKGTQTPLSGLYAIRRGI